MKTEYEMPGEAYDYGYKLGFDAGRDIRDRGGTSSKHHDPKLMCANDPYAIGYRCGLPAPKVAG